MNREAGICLVAIVPLFLAACSSQSAPPAPEATATLEAPAATPIPTVPAILHLKGADITEHNWTLYVRTLMVKQPAAAAMLCQQLKGLSATDARDLISRIASGQEDAATIPGAVPRPGQAGESASGVRTVGIVLAECQRVYGH